jgi:hypothetical protein
MASMTATQFMARGRLNPAHLMVDGDMREYLLVDAAASDVVPLAGASLELHAHMSVRCRARFRSEFGTELEFALPQTQVDLMRPMPGTTTQLCISAVIVAVHIGRSRSTTATTVARVVSAHVM